MKLILLYFVLGLFIGFMMVYILAPPPKVIIKHPTPKNINKTTYVDGNNVCYRYKKVKVSCNK